MKIFKKNLKLHIEKETEFVDITSKVAAIVKESGIREGLVNVFAKHTTAAIRVNENEPLLLKDIAEFLEQLAPRDAGYRHDRLEERDCPPNERINAHSHIRSLLMGASETVPISGGKIELGRWQAIFLVDLDGCQREREVVVQVIGE